MSHPRKGDRLLDLRTAAEIAGRHWRTLRNACKRRELNHVQERPRAKMFVWESDLLRWLEQGEKSAVRPRL